MAAQDRRLEELESRRTLIIVIAVAAAVVIALFFFLLFQVGGSGGTGDPRLEGAIRAGSQEFEQYKTQIVLDDPEATEAKRPLGDTVMSLSTTVRNLSNKTLVGLEIRGAVVDHQGQPVKEKTVIMIPTRQAELAPNKTMRVSVLLEGMKDTDDRANIKMEVAAVKFKE
ncbi:MAG TPA: hypothetical protein VN844_02390 [Pyrinomonadaceae bacterium]|nr:hypothetical protein [Pyrinomonadaceae bacterium]